MIGTAAVVQAPSDGYTLLLGSSSVGTTFAIRKQPDIDPRVDLTALAMLSRSPMTINIPSALPPKTLREFIDFARASPGKFNYATVGGSGSVVHLYTLLFLKAAGVEMEHIPYPGSPQAVPALMDNQVQLYIVDNGSIVGTVQSGRLRVLATASETRVPTFPQTPTTKELGFPFAATAWYGIFAPRNLPNDIRRVLQDHLQAVVADEGFRADMARRGAEPGTLAGDAFAKFLREEIDGWKAIIAEAKLELQ
jgi:tripartite-type tricarboxylate transporter receptor subunit TctC